MAAGLARVVVQTGVRRLDGLLFLLLVLLFLLLVLFLLLCVVLLFLGDHLLDTGEDAVVVLGGEFAIFVRLVHLHIPLVVEDHGDVGVLGDFVYLRLRACRGVDRQHDLFEVFFLGQVFELVLEVFIVVAENDETAHLGVRVLGGRRV